MRKNNRAARAARTYEQVRAVIAKLLPIKLSEWFVCADIDECSLIDEAHCGGSLEICINTMGSFHCECQDGFHRVNDTCEGDLLTLDDKNLLKDKKLTSSSKQNSQTCSQLFKGSEEVRESLIFA